MAKRFEGCRRDAAGAVRDLLDAVTCAALAGIEDENDALQHDEAEATVPVRVSSSPQSWDQRGGHMRHRSSIPDENDVDAVRKAARRCSRVEASTTILVDESLVAAAPYEGVFFEVRANDRVVAVGGCYGDVVARNVAPVERASLADERVDRRVAAFVHA